MPVGTHLQNQRACICIAVHVQGCWGFQGFAQLCSCDRGPLQPCLCNYAIHCGAVVSAVLLPWQSCNPPATHGCMHVQCQAAVMCTA